MFLVRDRTYYKTFTSNLLIKLKKLIYQLRLSCDSVIDIKNGLFLNKNVDLKQI
jgi:hypothetical protein